MIYITGDTHGDFKRRFNTDSFPEQKSMTKDDYLIICGDFGEIWDQETESRNEKYWFKWFEERPYTLLFVDGNHENFDRLNSYPVKEWHGGKVHEIRPHILHLMRGQVFLIDDRKIFTFGGAGSHDIQGGILEKDDINFREKKKQLERECIPYRINHISWWEQELASEDEINEGISNLKINNDEVDFIITHCCSSSTQQMIGGPFYKPDVTTDFLEYVKKNVSYKKWFFGHYHDNLNVSEKEILVYEQIIRIS